MRFTVTERCLLETSGSNPNSQNRACKIDFWCEAPEGQFKNMGFGIIGANGFTVILPASEFERYPVGSQFTLFPVLALVKKEETDDVPPV